MTTSTNSTRLTSKEACTLAHKIRRETGCSLTEAFKQAYSSNKPAPIKTTWTKAELTKVFSDKVAELLRKGYIIDTDHMSGHQGEIAKIRFTKNNAHYQLAMTNDHNFKNYYSKVIRITLGKYNREESSVTPNTTLWMEDFDTIWQFTVIQITENFFASEDLAETFNNKVSDRRIARHIPYYTDKDINRYGKALLACVRKQKGYKGTKLSDIARIRRYDEYDYNNHYTGHGYIVELSSKQTKNGKNVTIIVKVN